MRVFHFLNERWGLDDLRKRRLKISLLPELNDPFEFLAVTSSNPAIRNAFRVMKAEYSKIKGLLCFSRDWHNPVLWSHYADKHRGVCLGFDVPDEAVDRVPYSRKRLPANIEKLASPRRLNIKEATALLFTKYSHWRYENEVRGFVTLEDCDPQTHLYYTGFSDRLRLTDVIVGAESEITRAAIGDALGSLAPTVAARKARLAFGSFRVVRQKNERLWT